VKYFLRRAGWVLGEAKHGGRGRAGGEIGEQGS
jgi:hypothetical protein